MSYDLKPRHKTAGWFHAGGFSWSWLVMEGVGWPVGHYEGFTAGQYIATIFDGRKGNLDTNDGFHVTAGEAREMARLARYIAAKHRSRRTQWDKLPEAEQQRYREAQDRMLYHVNLPVREDFIEKAERFADWAEKSGGFWVK